MKRSFARGLLCLLAWPLLAPAAPVAGTCSAQAAAAPTVVELYTSEGCSSCPPADRWLSTLKGRPDLVALAFHVNYWDKLGWPDRFASAAYTERQRALMRPSGASYVYTPQVIVNGQDWRGWPTLPAGRAAAAPAPALTLSRDGALFTADVGSAGSPLAGYWAVVEDEHATQVRAGENSGSALRHDHVVRRYEPVPGWAAATPQRLRWRVEAGATATPRRVVFVVTDGVTQRPVQALALGC